MRVCATTIWAAICRTEVFMQILSYVLSFLGLVSMIVASLIKSGNMKKILFLVFCGNFLVAVSYLVGGSGINGAASCFLGAAQTVVNYFFESKGKPIPKWLTVIYALSFVVLNLAVSGFNIELLTVIAIVATLSFVMSIGQGNVAKYRFWIVVNSVLWCTYDILSKSYSALATHVPLLIFTVAGMIIHDRKSKKEKTEE